MVAMELGIQAAKDDLADEKEIYVRIKPRNERKGIRKRRHRVNGMQFAESAGWYKISRYMTSEVSGRTQAMDMRVYFENVRNTDNPDSPLAFDVCTEAEARAVDEEERKKAEPKRKSANPVDLTSAEVRPSRGMQAVEQAPPRRPGRPRKARPAAPEAEPETT